MKNRIWKRPFRCYFQWRNIFGHWKRHACINRTVSDGGIG